MLCRRARTLTAARAVEREAARARNGAASMAESLVYNANEKAPKSSACAARRPAHARVVA